jgi:allene oxide cyclase
MRRSLRAVVGSAIVVSLAIVATAGGKSATATATFKLVEHATTDATTNPGKKNGTGSILTFANAVYNAANTKKVGSDNGFCILTNANTAYECLWTTYLAGGQLTVEGPFLFSGDSKLAVTGGTGAYSRARGWMGLHARNAKGTEYDFDFHIQG